MRAARELGAPDFAAARRLIVLDDLPRLGNGKVDYVALSRHG